MPTSNAGRPKEIRSLISTFLSDRLNAKLDKLSLDDPKRADLCTAFVPAVWLGDAARRVTQIQAVTHSLKPIHPDARGSNLYCNPCELPAIDEVGSHALGENFDSDVVGNAAALDVYKFLKLRHGERSLLELAVAGDTDFAAALSDDVEQGRAWMAAFAGLATPRSEPASHTLAKQIYWPVGADPHDDACYHLLAPLYPTSLVHRFYQRLQNDRFSDEAKAARDARKQGVFHERPVREYPNLVIQTLGGTKPQNISQLNSERRGANFLLASLPPEWLSLEVKPLYGVTSLFKRYGPRREVRSLIKQLRSLLAEDPARNIHTRRTRDDLVLALIDELVQFSAELRTLAPGWSTAPECDLPPAQRAFLDPLGSGVTVEDIVDRVAADFANWLNAQLREPLPVGDPEFHKWRKLASEPLHDMQEEVAHEQ